MLQLIYSNFTFSFFEHGAVPTFTIKKKKFLQIVNERHMWTQAMAMYENISTWCTSTA